MTKCQRCGQEIIGRVFKQTIYCGSAVFIPRTYCYACYHEVLEQQRNMRPLLFFMLILTIGTVLLIILGV